MSDETLPKRFRHLELEEKPPVPSEGKPVPIYDAHHFFEAGQRDFYRRDYESALRNYSRALRHDRQRVEAWVGQVRALLEIGELEEALVWCNRGLDRFNDHPSLLAMKGWIMAVAGDTEKGLAFVDAAFQEKKTDDPLLWLARAAVLFLENSPNARYCLEKAVEEGRGSWQTVVDAGRLALRYGAPELALKFAQPAQVAVADRPEILVLLGETYQALNSPAQAQVYFRRALALDPGCPIPQSYAAEPSKGWLARIRSLLGL
ncbi:MAG: tetratricopeptide repeat protein [Armatimonadetes bacterium]|nr:tetratricopeptide repeat protein [Armatimonadota bacterium]MDW8120867.1 tetratricopeptide repeat protein [Armatimonadota bacterium]